MSPFARASHCKTRVPGIALKQPEGQKTREVADESGWGKGRLHRENITRNVLIDTISLTEDYE